jgi:hypothetical protein
MDTRLVSGLLSDLLYPIGRTFADRPPSLAYAELYMGLGLLIRRLGDRLELFETTSSDVEIHYDRFVPTPREGTEEIRILVRPASE